MLGGRKIRPDVLIDWAIQVILTDSAANNLMQHSFLVDLIARVKTNICFRSQEE